MRVTMERFIWIESWVIMNISLAFKRLKREIKILFLLSKDFQLLFVKTSFLAPRSMIPDTVFHEFSGWNPQETHRFRSEPAGKCQEFDVGIWWPYPACSGRNRTNPVTGFVHRNTASTFRWFPVFSCRIRPVLLDLSSMWGEIRWQVCNLEHNGTIDCNTSTSSSSTWINVNEWSEDIYGVGKPIKMLWFDHMYLYLINVMKKCVV
jgi:hypothetical protein